MLFSPDLFNIASGDSECTSESCVLGQKIIGACIVTVVIGIIIYYLQRLFRDCTHGLPSQANIVYILQRPARNRNLESDPFETGIWTFRCYQYGKLNGPFRLSIRFDHSAGTVSGHGNDNVGNFTIDGFFSSRTLRLGLLMKYQLGTGDRRENMGHTATVQLKWNSAENRYDGKWYVRVPNYRGEGKFELELQETSTRLLDANTACWKRIEKQIDSYISTKNNKQMCLSFFSFFSHWSLSQNEGARDRTLPG